MKAPGDRKKQNVPHHTDKYPDKYSSSSKSKHGQVYKDRRQPAAEKSSSQKANDEGVPSQHLWIGNVSTSVTKTMLAEQFSRFGDIQSIKLFSQKNYAFVTLKTVEDAVYAKKGLHGTVIGGLAVRIEFARGAHDSRPNNHAEGDEKSLNEKEKQTDEKIIYQDQGHKDVSQEKKVVLTKVATLEDTSRQASDVSKGNKNCDPSEVLWIGFPLHLKIDEKKLHKLFAPFGGVEKITTFPGRTYAFVRFQNVKAASRAKDALQGKLFDDPRVSISFAKSEVGPVDHFQPSSGLRPPSPSKAAARTLLSSPVKGEEGISNLSVEKEMDASKYSNASPKKNLVLPSIPLPSIDPVTQGEIAQVNKDSLWSASRPFPPRPGTGLNEKPYAVTEEGMQPTIKLDMKDEFSGNTVSKHMLTAELEKGMQMDEFPVLKDPKCNDNWMLHEYTNIRDSKRGRSEMESNHMGVLFSTGSPSKILENIKSHGDDGETKRQRSGKELFWAEPKSSSLPDYVDQRGNLSPETWDEKKTGNLRLLGRPHVGNVNEEELNASLRSEENHQTMEGSISLLGRMPSADLSTEQPLGSQSEHGLVVSSISPARTDGGSPICPPPKDVFRWEGTIAKGGTEVCRCRCFPATKEINVIFPSSLNCTARTSLDMLAQYISQVKEFSVVLFMPEGVADVAPYQELMAFLADKKRAAVCKLSEENTLFLVPPSDFVEQFLNVPKSNNILGVVLGQQQERSRPSQTSTDCSTLQHSFDSKIAYKSSEGRTDMTSVKALSSQQTLYPLESSKVDPSMSTPFQDMFGKNMLGPDISQDCEVALDSSRISYGTQGNKLLTREYLARESSLLPDTRNLPFQIPNTMHMPMAQGLHIYGSSSLPSGSTMLAHQDSVMLSRPPVYFPPRIPEHLSVPGSNQMMNDTQKPSGSFSFPERPGSTAGTPQSVLMTQMNTPMPHMQPMFSYGPISQQQFPVFDVRQQDGQAQSSNFGFRLSGTNTRNVYSPHPLVSEFVPRPPGLPPGLPSLDSSLRPPAPPIISTPSSLSQDQEKEGPDTDQQQAFQAALARMQTQDSSEEEQKKFRATVELAAALLQQLQKQTKL